MSYQGLINKISDKLKVGPINLINNFKLGDYSNYFINNGTYYCPLSI